MEFIATFYSHYGAVAFRRLCRDAGIEAKTAPVPRALSSSCGTCVIYRSEQAIPFSPLPEELEQIARKQGASYEILYKAAD